MQFSNTRLRQASVFADNTWGDWRSRVTLSEQSDRGAYDDNGFYGSSDQVETTRHDSQLGQHRSAGRGWLVTAGLERQRQKVETSSSSPFNTPYDVNRNATALFGGVEGEVGVGSLQVNVRHDKVGDLSQVHRVTWVTRSRQRRLQADWQTSRPPSTRRRWATCLRQATATPISARKPPSSQELGIQYEASGQLLRATWFNTRVTDQLEYDRTTYSFANIGRTRNQGLEVSYKGMVGATQLRASLTLQNPKNDLTGEQLARRAKTLWSVGASHTVGALALDADVRGSGRRPDRYTDVATFTTVDTQLPSYAVLDLAAAYALTPELALRARIDNVTDKGYQTVYGYNQQPRSLYVGLSWSPKF